jgi:hypothetical protein
MSTTPATACVSSVVVLTIRILCIFVVVPELLTVATAAPPGGITLTGDTPWVLAGSSGVVASGVDENDDVEPMAFQLALRDVKLDWYRVLGNPPAIQGYPLRLSTDEATSDG